MIVCRKPFTIYDVDVIGVAALLIIGAAACVAVIMPADASAAERRDISARIAEATANSENTNARLCDLNKQITTLHAGVSQNAAAAPRPGALTSLLQRVASLAKVYDLEITQLLPQPAQAVDDCIQADVSLSARGRTLDFLRLLEQLSRENPYCALRDFTIKRAASTGEDRCQLSWTLRLYMLALEEPAGSTGEKP